MPDRAVLETQRLDPRKFVDPNRTATGESRARVELAALTTLWFNTGTICNLTCRTCYIESSPTNDRLAYLTADEVATYLDEIRDQDLPTKEIGFTGGEPFINPHFLEILETTLARGFQVLVLTNAMRPMLKCAEGLLALRERYGDKLVHRVSIDHYTRDLHEVERGPRTWEPTLKGLAWLTEHGFVMRAAGRSCWGEPEAEARLGYARLFASLAVPIDAQNPEALVIFPEMDATADVPEITESCWNILGVTPDEIMCASSRMVVKRKGEAKPVVMPCTLLPYQDDFVMGQSLAEAAAGVALNHPHCARFCVLGGGSCSRAS